MADRIAIKRLTASDCTLFEAVFRTIDVGKQKSINLNADVLIDQLYPGLAAPGAASDNEIALPMTIYGPAGKPAHTITRKIIKNSTYKNWRLNGEFIRAPMDDTSRYDNVRPGDLAVMAFTGASSPTRLDMILVSHTDPADTALYTCLAALFGNKSMIAVTQAQIASAVATAAIPENHPVLVAAADPELEVALEDAAQGDFEGAGKVLKNKPSRRISKADLLKAKAKAELVGQDGEGLLNGYFAAQVESGKLAGYVWAAATNAIAPFDFEVTDAHGQKILVDAKATNGAFENTIHLSLAEVIEAAGPTPYQIYRLFELNADGGQLKISEDISPLAGKLKLIHETHMPAGTRVDGYSIATAALTWEAAVHVAREDDGGGV